MENNTDPQKKIKENDPSADNKDGKVTKKHEDDSFKSSDKKHRLGWEQPLDEQQLDDKESPDEQVSD